MKGRIALFAHRAVIVEPPSAACSYWRLNHAFCWVHRSRDSQCCLMGRTRTTPKIAPSCRGIWIPI